MSDAEFQELIWQKGGELYRAMPWRDQPTLYNVLVSELMLQQTQVSRVMVKFAEFMRKFPDVRTLANADLAEVLRVWQGLGYNRRAKYLHQAAMLIDRQPFAFDGSQEAGVLRRELSALPGVGVGTLGALMNYVYERPTAYVETNIRTVYFHHYFYDRTDISDAEVLRIVEATLDGERPRQWFWALMDYGSYLKATSGGRLTQSRHYKKQSALKGSVREVRGRIIAKVAIGPLSYMMLADEYRDDGRLDIALEGLVRDGLIVVEKDVIRLTN